MLGYFSQLAIQGILKKRKRSILIFLVLLITFSCTFVVLSIVSSISKTNEEYRLNTYGEWAFAVLPANGQEAWVEQQSFVEGMGKVSCYGITHTGWGDIGIGTVDDQFLELGRIVLENGCFPTTETEIAMEADALSALGYDYTLGQDISLVIDVSLFSNASAPGENETLPCYVKKAFKLCGVIREFSNIWAISGQNEQQLLVSAFITPTAAKQLFAEAEISSGSAAPYTQLFLDVSQDNRAAASGFLSGKNNSQPQRIFFENKAAYPESTPSDSPDLLYTLLMGIASLAAVFSVFFMQIKDSYHTLAVWRSVGMSKKQLAILLTLETLFLAIPAILLGVLLGGGLTYLSLRLLVYSGSAPIQVSIPTKSLFIIALLWVVCTELCRLLLFFIVVHAQLTGGFQFGGAKSKRFSQLTKFAVFLLTAVFGATVFFTRLESIVPLYLTQYWGLCPSYTIYSNGKTVREHEKRLIEHIPGISRVDGIVEAPVTISFPGVEEINTWLYAIDEKGWTETFDFGSQEEAFHDGAIVFLSFMGDANSIPTDGMITLRFMENDVCVIEKSTYVLAKILSTDIMNRGLAHLYDPCAIICSEKFLKDALSQMEIGQSWDKYAAGDNFGYGRVYAYADLNSGFLSTDITLAEFCTENNLLLDNRRQEFLSKEQENMQTLIFLFSAGGCIAFVSLLLMCNLLQMEAEQEQKSFAIMRAIGMSRHRLRLRVFRQSFVRSFAAILTGALAYWVYAIASHMKDGAGVMQAWVDATHGLSYYSYTTQKLVLLFVICVIVPFAVSLFVKVLALKEGCESK